MFTTQMVKEAVEKNKIGMVSGAWITMTSSSCSACALTQLAIANAPIIEELVRSNGEYKQAPASIVYEVLSEKFGMTEAYMNGFVYGFDSESEPRDAEYIGHDEWSKGCTDAERIKTDLIKEGML